jgi:DNA-binding protein YbaB
MSIDADEWLRDWEQRIDDHSRRVQQLSHDIQAATVTCESRGGEVVVTVDSSGGLADLRLTDRAARLSLEDLTNVIMGTSRRAQAQMAKRMHEMAAGVLGPDSETAGFISSVYAEKFPEQPEDDGRGAR